ncbi:hypothetical protein [Undibacterium griseum]|uniref:Uncharacterized protein n=1 Tax=Undibacterium griseum TaxID=2762295 RepID=A0ABR6YP71_9BURK|nr:hypothetical protein [Undibacterium griseum]MBC3885692.1 hypothetical protein [Undibacterium griseum]
MFFHTESLSVKLRNFTASPVVAASIGVLPRFKRNRMPESATGKIIFLKIQEKQVAAGRSGVLDVMAGRA